MQNYLTLNVELSPDRMRASAAMLTTLADLIQENAGESLIKELDAGNTANAAEVFRTPPAGTTVAAPAAPAPSAPGATDEDNEPEPGALRFIGTIQVDSEDLPHDSRIHADSKKFLAKTGQWKLKRNMPESTVEKVKAELKISIDALKAGGAKVTPAPVGTAAPSAPAAPAPAAPQAPAFVNTLTGAPSAEKVPAPPAAPAAPAASSAAPPPPAGAAVPGEVPMDAVTGDADADFTRVVKRITDGIAAKKFGTAEIQKMYAHFGAGSVPALKLNPAKFPEIHQYLAMLEMGLPPQ